MTISIAGRRRPAAWLACLFLATVASPAFAGRTVSIHRMQPREHGAATGVTLEQMRGVVLSVAERNGWVAVVRANGAVEVTMAAPDRERRAVVEVKFDDRTYVVRYRDSVGLEYDDEFCVPIPGTHGRTQCREVIDSDYNDWAEGLEEQVGAQLARLRPGDPVDEKAAVPTVPAPAAADSADRSRLFVADEIRKLKQLQDEGVLTDEEFEEQKRKLLAR
jgi:hypothetical protein